MFCRILWVIGRVLHMPLGLLNKAFRYEIQPGRMAPNVLVSTAVSTYSADAGKYQQFTFLK